MKLICAGSREVEDEDFVHRYLNSLHLHEPITAIVSGLAKGPDSFGKNWALVNGIPVLEFPADWNRYGNAAGPIRNEEMMKVGDALVAFWDGQSPGTKNMISLMRKAGKANLVIIMPSKKIEELDPLGDMF